MTGLSTWRSLGRWPLALRFGAIGALAGFVAWAVVFVASPLFDVAQPSTIALLLAVPRGALYGVILAIILRAYWDRSQRHRDSESNT